MLLFLTREAFWRRSIELRRVGEGDPRPMALFSEFLFCQNRRGEVVPSIGELWNGEESVLRPILRGWRDVSGGEWDWRSSRRRRTEEEKAGGCACSLTLAACIQLGELRRFSAGEISERGLGAGVFFDSRKGWTWYELGLWAPKLPTEAIADPRAVVVVVVLLLVVLLLEKGRKGRKTGKLTGQENVFLKPDLAESAQVSLSVILCRSLAQCRPHVHLVTRAGVEGGWCKLKRRASATTSWRGDGARMCCVSMYV